MNNVSVGGSRSIISRILKSAGSEGEKARGFCYFYAKIARRQSQGKSHKEKRYHRLFYIAYLSFYLQKLVCCYHTVLHTLA